MANFFFKLLFALDEFGNALLGGDPDETISSRIGKIRKAHGGEIPWSRPVSKIADWALERIEPGHSIDAIEEDEGKDAVFDRD